MRAVFTAVLVVLLIVVFTGTVIFKQDAAAKDAEITKVAAFVRNRLLKLDYGRDPRIVAAVKAENSRVKPLEQIEQIDDTWHREPLMSDFMLQLLHNDCSLYLRRIQRTTAFYGEIFVMDAQGALVALTERTSDYWQADEDKFIKSFKDGKGAVFISDSVEFDISSRKNLAHVSIPVMDGNAAIGVITFGIDIDKLK